MDKESFYTKLARMVLYVLVLIHLVLPFTPANHHDELRITIASVLFGLVFLYFAWISKTKPYKGFKYGLIFLLTLYCLSAITEASPISEGLIIKIIFVVILLLGLLANKIKKSS